MRAFSSSIEQEFYSAAPWIRVLPIGSIFLLRVYGMQSGLQDKKLGSLCISILPLFDLLWIVRGYLFSDDFHMISQLSQILITISVFHWLEIQQVESTHGHGFDLFTAGKNIVVFCKGPSIFVYGFSQTDKVRLKAVGPPPQQQNIDHKKKKLKKKKKKK